MVSKTVTESDLSGAADAEETFIGVEGEWFAVDLTEGEAAELKSTLDPYVQAGRVASLPGTVGRRHVPETTPEEREAIREWARSNGLKVADYGQIPGAVYDAHAEAHRAA